MPPQAPRLAYLVSQYPAVNHTYILAEVQALRSLGIGVEVISVSPPDRPDAELAPDEREEAARTYYVKRAGLRAFVASHAGALVSRPVRYLAGLLLAARLSGLNPRALAHWLAYFAEAVIVGRWMLSRDLRHLHVHYSSSVGMLAGTVFPVEVSQSIHGSGEFENPAAFRLREKIGQAVFVRAISLYGRSQLMKHSEPGDWGKIEIVRLGVDPAALPPRPHREAPERFEILTVGQLAPAKGQHVLIRAAGALAREGRRLRVRIVGDGPLRESLAALVESEGLRGDVRLEGYLNHEDVIRRYAETDIFVLSSFAEGVPVVLMEAMAMEIPCVASRITGIPELIEEGESGLLVAPSGVEDLARALARLMDDAGLRLRLGRAARRRVLAEYDLGRNAARLAEIFRARVT